MKELAAHLLRLSRVGHGYDVSPSDRKALEDASRTLEALGDAAGSAAPGGGAAPGAALHATPVWPDFVAPPKYEDPPPGWTDPGLPNFRTIWEAARLCGYAVGLHGSMRRDVDLIAVPWTDDAISHYALIELLCSKLNARQIGSIETKPHGRVAVILQIDGWYRPIDLSITARNKMP